MIRKELMNGETVLSIGALTTLESCRHLVNN